jgi:Restriction endonuclease
MESASGKEIEELVATIEGLLLPKGFTVTKNPRIYNDHGVQVAEFDVEIRGKLGSADIAWLIECRNRPGDGPAPGQWIEQLMGRRNRFNFDKVMAVSTTGFSQGAIECAHRFGIALRAVDEIAPELTLLVRMRSMISRERCHILKHVEFVIDATEPPESIQAAQAVLSEAGDKPLDAPMLRSTSTGAIGTALQAFLSVVAEHPELWEDILPNQEPKPVVLRVDYPTDNHFVLDTALGPVRISTIHFDGAFALKESEIPLDQVAEYRQVGGDHPISQTAGFLVPMNDATVAFELHRIEESGAIMMTMRQVPKEKIPE